MAACHAGILALSCHECQDAPEFREDQGCEIPSESVVWQDEDNEFYSCPIKWITEEITDWYQEVTYQQEFGIAEPYHSQSNRFLEAWSFYRYHLSRFQKQQQEIKSDKSADALSSIRAGVKSRNQDA